jgi:hypothetical protein
MVIPVITGATGIATKILKENLTTLPGKLSYIFTTGDSFTWNSIHNTESAAV